jgi:hypothetical protein
MNRCAALTVAPALLILGGVACAQTTAPPGPPVQAAPASPARPNCTPDARASTPENRSSTNGSGQPSLSDRLAAQNGVICPPADVDPQMRVPPPGGGRMLVVPPPGSPGGDPNTIPK